MARKTFREMVEALKASPKPLRGSVKLSRALDAFGIDVGGAVCLDVGASTGGFTTTLLERGAARVYAVDVGHGQLLGSLRQDPRVVNLEATNVADLDQQTLAEAIHLVCIDVSYLSLREAVGQLDRVAFSPGARLVGLVKPMFELRLATAPTDDAELERAIELAADAMGRSGWSVLATAPSAVRGAKGALEGWIVAQRVV